MPANNRDLIYYPITVSLDSNINEYLKSHEDNLNRLFDYDREARKRGTSVGRYFAIPVADGRAYYQVIKEFKNVVHIQLVTDVGDDWADHHFGNGGSFPKKDVMRYLQKMDAFREIFARA
jgi:hypothetical protein